MHCRGISKTGACPLSSIDYRVQLITLSLTATTRLRRTALVGYQTQFIDQPLQKVMERFPRKGRGTMTGERVESSGPTKKPIDSDSDEEDKNQDGKDTRKVKPVINSRRIKQQASNMKATSAKVDTHFKMLDSSHVTVCRRLLSKRRRRRRRRKKTRSPL